MRLLNRYPLLLTILIGLSFVLVWHFLTLPSDVKSGQPVDPEYAKLMGGSKQTQANQSAVPGPIAVVERAGELLGTAFRRNGENDIGVGWHLYESLKRVLLGFTLAVVVAVPLGFAIGLSPLLNKAIDPYVQLLRPVSPLAWMPLALYTLKDSGASAIFIIFISALWPMLINTTYGAGSVRQDWINVSRVLGLSTWKRLRLIILPASVPMILTGMRISIGIAWFVIVAAEMVSGQNGIGFFVWNEWNNLQIASMIVAILLIGSVGLLLDQMLAFVMRRLSFRE
jgi:nitrate/nitrite transport system permease protein